MLLLLPCLTPPQAIRSVKGILNKLTPEKFERLLNQLLEVITTSDILKHTITLVFENAVAQPTFCAMYADLCLSLSRELPSFPPPEGEDKPVAFKRVLLNTCQDEFEGAATAREVRGHISSQLGVVVGAHSLAGASARIATTLHTAWHLHECPNNIRREEASAGYPGSTFLSLLPCLPLQELANITAPDERVAVEKRVKSRTLGTVRLIAELYRKEVVKEAIIVVCLRELLEVRRLLQQSLVSHSNSTYMHMQGDGSLIVGLM